MSAGKGDRPRPMDVSRKEYEDRWERTFGGGGEEGHVGVDPAKDGEESRTVVTHVDTRPRKQTEVTVEVRTAHGVISASAEPESWFEADVAATAAMLAGEVLDNLKVLHLQDPYEGMREARVRLMDLLSSEPVLAGRDQYHTGAPAPKGGLP